MAYSDFSLSSVKKAFQLKLIEEIDLFKESPKLEPSALLQEILKENLSLPKILGILAQGINAIAP